tara:strand:- start:12780 stop:13067 length:288 start_codon:yes stop_codon:yes gene_type:complete
MKQEDYKDGEFGWARVREYGIYRQNGKRNPGYELIDVTGFLRLIHSINPNRAIDIAQPFQQVISRQVEARVGDRKRPQLQNTLNLANTVLENLRR